MEEKTFKRGNLEKQITSLPTEVKFCKKCVISNQRPKITFDEEGVCSACRNANYKNQIDWKKREKELEELLDKYRKNDGSWDVIVPSSGGKDSGFVAHQLKHKYGMHPLTLTWTPLVYTEIGFRNFQNFIKAGYTNLMCSPNGNLHRKLARLSFEELGDAFHVFVLGQVAFPMQMAVKLNIPLIFYGENGSVEYAGDPKLADKPYIPNTELGARMFKGSTFSELVQYGLDHKDYFQKTDFQESDLLFYQIPALEDLERVGVQRHYFSYYHKWTPQENYYYAVENTLFEPNPERSEGTYSKYASLDDRLDGMHYFMGYIKFGIGRATQDASHEIRDGHLTREDAIALVTRYDGEFPRKYFKDFLEYLDISEEHFWRVADSYRLPHIWEKNGAEWKLKHKVSQY